MAAAAEGRIEILPLPIAGLMSTSPAKEVSDRLTTLKALVKAMGG